MFPLIVLGGIAVAVGLLVLLAKLYPGTGADLLDWGPARSHEHEVERRFQRLRDLEPDRDAAARQSQHDRARTGEMRQPLGELPPGLAPICEQNSAPEHANHLVALIRSDEDQSSEEQAGSCLGVPPAAHKRRRRIG